MKTPTTEAESTATTRLNRAHALNGCIANLSAAQTRVVKAENAEKEWTGAVARATAEMQTQAALIRSNTSTPTERVLAVEAYNTAEHEQIDAAEVLHRTRSELGTARQALGECAKELHAAEAHLAKLLLPTQET